MSNNTIRQSFPVVGLGCAACVAKVQTALKGCTGVEDASVSLASNMARVDYDPSVVDPKALQKAVQNAGYDIVLDEAGEAEEEAERIHQDFMSRLKRDVIGAVGLSVVLMLLSMGFRDFPGKPWFLCGLSTLIIVLFGRRFFVTAWRQLKHGGANMDTLVALSVSISWLFSVFNLLFPSFWTSKGLSAALYFDSSAMIISFILLGRLIEEKAKAGAAASVRKLAGLQPKTVNVLRRPSCAADGSCADSEEAGLLREVKVPVAEVVPGDVVVVRSGERFAVDGEMTEGEAYVDESMLTGEPMAVHKSLDSKVFAGTVCQNGYAMVRTLKTGRDTVLSSIVAMVRDAQGSRVRIQNLVDKIASVFVPVVIALSLLTLLAWGTFGGAWATGLLCMVNVLVVACPCALGLATPAAIVAGIGKGAELGILVKDADSLQVASKVDVVVVDKTGTLTTGKMAVTEAWFASESAAGAVLWALENRSSHPLAGAVKEYLGGAGTAGGNGADLQGTSNSDASGLQEASYDHDSGLHGTYRPDAVDLKDFKEMAGIGVKAKLAEDEYFAGKMLPPGTHVPEEASPFVAKGKSAGTSVIYFTRKRTHVASVDGEQVPKPVTDLLGVLLLSDSVRETAAEAVSSLQALGVEVHMLTGDNEASARAVADAVGIETVVAGVMPGQKQGYIADLQNVGRVVAMAGDGINDSAALAKANLSVAMGTGTDVAMEASMVTIASSDLRKVAGLILLSRKSVRIIRENLFWAFIYNLVMVPVAAGVLLPAFGISLTPMICAACMAMSSICVVTNSLRLRL